MTLLVVLQCGPVLMVVAPLSLSHSQYNSYLLHLRLFDNKAFNFSVSSGVQGILHARRVSADVWLGDSSGRQQSADDHLGPDAPYDLYDQGAGLHECGPRAYVGPCAG